MPSDSGTTTPQAKELVNKAKQISNDGFDKMGRNIKNPSKASNKNQKIQEYYPLHKVIIKCIEGSHVNLREFHRNPAKKKFTVILHLGICILIMSILNEQFLRRAIFESIPVNAVGWFQSNILYGYIALEVYKRIISKIDFTSSIALSIILCAIIWGLRPIVILLDLLRNRVDNLLRSSFK